MEMLDNQDAPNKTRIATVAMDGLPKHGLEELNFSYTVPVVGRSQSIHILCQKTDCWGAGSTNSFQPGTGLQPVYGMVAFADSIHASVMRFAYALRLVLVAYALISVFG